MKAAEEPEPTPAQFDTYYDYFRAWHKWDRKRILQEAKTYADDRSGAYAGIGIGAGMAMILSYQLNHSVLWMIVHGVCSWFYVIYRAWEGNY